jgi:hypothetical protein
VCNQLTSSEEIEVKDLINKLIGEDKFSWANWTIVRVFNRSQKLRYALYAAKSVLHIFEEKYPEDKRPANTIHLVEKYIEDKNLVSQEELIAARRAADGAAYDAASVADATYYAAARAAYYAAYAYDAANADAYAAAAYYAAYAAANAAARKEQYKQILAYGLTLIKE